jgi:GNAT superfamily N-acetyltransferase
VLRFASRTWDGWDYIPHAWPVWLAATDGVLLVATGGEADASSPAVDADGTRLPADEPIAVARIALLSATEGWLEGIRVDPRVRGLGVATDLQTAELHWLAAHHTTIIRYATGESNEASHRLGGRHGFELLTQYRTWVWHDPERPAGAAHANNEANGFDEPTRRAATERRRALLERLAEEGRVVADADAKRWWARVSADPAFSAAGAIYERRAWAMQELTEPGFVGHVAAAEVVAIDDAGGWAMAIIPAEALPTEDVSLHLALLVGEGDAPASLADAIRRRAGEPIRFRLPADADPARDRNPALEAAGFAARPTELHILSRQTTAGALPQIDSRRLTLRDAPSRVIEPPP